MSATDPLAPIHTALDEAEYLVRLLNGSSGQDQAVGVAATVTRAGGLVTVLTKLEEGTGAYTGPKAPEQRTAPDDGRLGVSAGGSCRHARALHARDRAMRRVSARYGDR